MILKSVPSSEIPETNIFPRFKHAFQKQKFIMLLVIFGNVSELFYAIAIIFPNTKYQFLKCYQLSCSEFLVQQTGLTFTCVKLTALLLTLTIFCLLIHVKIRLCS